MYPQIFYKKNAAYTANSAKEIVPHIIKLIKPKSVLDVGCAYGVWLNEFYKNGVKDVYGIDNFSPENKYLLITQDKYLQKDLNKSFDLKKSFDLVICLEVAEHLPKKSALKLIKSLVKHSNIIIFSAAIPFQGGYKHLNEQWPEYWVKIFQKQNFIVIDCLRKTFWNNLNVDYWYSQNILLFVKKDQINKYPILLNELKNTGNGPLSLVHPKLYMYWGNSLEKFRYAISNRIKNIKK
jgi:SAM-dependent methyltransferase